MNRNLASQVELESSELMSIKIVRFQDTQTEQFPDNSLFGDNVKNPPPTFLLPRRAALPARLSVRGGRHNCCRLFLSQDVLGPIHAHKSPGHAATMTRPRYTCPDDRRAFPDC